jgi:hypothetical protein
LIERPWGVTAFGEGTIRAEPDHAVIRLVVNRTSDSPRNSLDEAKAAVTAVRDVLRAHGIPDEQVMSSQVRVHSTWDGNGEAKERTAHHSRVELLVRVTTLDLVEPVLVAVVDAGADEILEIVYDTSRSDDLNADAQEKAVAAAHTKARLYAEAANVRLGPVVHIEDLDPAVGPARSGSRHGWAAAAQAPGGGGDLAPGLITFSASVALGFLIIR